MRTWENIAGLPWSKTEAPVQHVEFFDTTHFEENYYRVKPSAPLHRYIDFVWQTRFDHLWAQFPQGFSDVLFPNTGYTYLLNLGTPFVMQVGRQKFPMKTDGFLPRPDSIECFHQPGNCLFGVKFRLSPVLFSKKIDFSEYRSQIYPLSYLINKPLLDAIKSAPDFETRAQRVFSAFEKMTEARPEHVQALNTVSELMWHYGGKYPFTTSIGQMAADYGISTRTLHRHFLTTTGISPKKALQILRMRKALETISRNPAGFTLANFGYYDSSHFCKHLRSFLSKDTIEHLRPHLKILESMRQSG